MSNLSYEPAEERRGVLATLALIGALVALGVVLMAASPGGGEVEESGERGDPGREAGEGAAAPSAPDDLSFLCAGDYGTEEVILEAEARDRVQEEVERFVLTVPRLGALACHLSGGGRDHQGDAEPRPGGQPPNPDYS